MSTQDCKELIKNISKEFLLNPKDKWKRTKKYKEDNLVLRDFEGTSGDVVTISENLEGEINIYAIHLKDSEMSEDAELMCGAGLYALEEWVEQNMEEGERINLGRISKDYELDGGANLINEMIYRGESFMDDIHYTNISFDTENKMIFERQGEHGSYLYVLLGGDWQMPIFAYVYWSEQAGRLKGFVPVGKGNFYNVEKSAAYETYEDKELIDKNSYEEAESIGMRQLEQHIAREYQNYFANQKKPKNKMSKN